MYPLTDFRHKKIKKVTFLTNFLYSTKKLMDFNTSFMYFCTQNIYL